jgi:mRNA interferase MazF
MAKELTSPRRGEVYLVSFDPTLGAEIKKTRPALILQNNVANRYSPITIVAAITSQVGEKLYPTEVFVRAPEGGLRTDGVILLNQIRSIDKRRLMKRLGHLKIETMEHVNQALRISLGFLQL